MPYDSSLDVCLAKKVWEDENNRLTVGILSYNNGQKKMQISREGKNADGDYRFAKLGRLTRQEAEAIIPLMQELVKEME